MTKLIVTFRICANPLTDRCEHTVSFEATTLVLFYPTLPTPCSEVECKTTGYPLHSHVPPSFPLACVTVCHQVSTELYI